MQSLINYTVNIFNDLHVGFSASITACSDASIRSEKILKHIFEFCSRILLKLIDSSRWPDFI